MGGEGMNGGMERWTERITKDEKDEWVGGQLNSLKHTYYGALWKTLSQL